MNTVGCRLDHDKAKVNTLFLLVPKMGVEGGGRLGMLCKVINTVGCRLDHDKAKVNTLFLLVPKMAVEGWRREDLECLCKIMNYYGS